jgi:hypothetical protein
MLSVVKIMLRSGFKKKAKLSGMERTGIVSYNSTLVALDNQMEKLETQKQKVHDEFLADWKEIAERHGLDPNLPPDCYQLEKKVISVRPENIPSDHTEDLPDEQGEPAES